MLTSADHARHRKLAETESSRDLESLLVVGDAVFRLPMSASTSLKPRTTSRAFARGLPSALRLHFKRILLVSVLSGVASSAVLTPKRHIQKNCEVLSPSLGGTFLFQFGSSTFPPLRLCSWPF